MYRKIRKLPQDLFERTATRDLGSHHPGNDFGCCCHSVANSLALKPVLSSWSDPCASIYRLLLESIGVGRVIYDSTKHERRCKPCCFDNVQHDDGQRGNQEGCLILFYGNHSTHTSITLANIVYYQF